MEFSHKQRQKLADIAADIAQVSLGSVVIPFVLESPDGLVALIGIALSIAFWTLSLVLLEKL